MHTVVYVVFCSTWTNAFLYSFESLFKFQLRIVYLVLFSITSPFVLLEMQQYHSEPTAKCHINANHCSEINTERKADKQIIIIFQTKIKCWCSTKATRFGMTHDFIRISICVCVYKILVSEKPLMKIHIPLECHSNHSIKRTAHQNFCKINSAEKNGFGPFGLNCHQLWVYCFWIHRLDGISENDGWKWNDEFQKTNSI